MRSLPITSLLFLSLTLFLVSCKQQSSSTFKASEAGLSISSDQDPATMGIDVRLTASLAEVFDNFKWTVKDEAGAAVSGCSGSSTATLVCNFKKSGLMSINLSAINSTGETINVPTTLRVLDPAAAQNQAPRLIVKIKNSALTDVATYSSNSSLNAGSMNQPVGSYNFDLSQTLDDQDLASNLSFKIKINSGSLQSVGLRSTQSFASVGVYSITIQATDTNGATASVNFTAYIKCDETITPRLNVSNALIAVSPQSVRNFYTYSVAGVTGGSSPSNFQYTWDQNGDKLLDARWSASSSATGYTIYSGQRNITANIWDTSCNYFASVTQPITFDITKADTTGSLDSLVGSGEYSFLQGNVRPVSSVDSTVNHLETADVVINHYLAGPSSPKRVVCDYRKASRDNGVAIGNPDAYFSIDASNQYSHDFNYDPTSRQYVPYKHGIYLSVQGIKDSNGIAGQGSATIDTSAAYINWIQVTTDGGQDQTRPFKYTKTADCALEMKVINLGLGVVPCAEGTGSAYAVRIEGKFHCPQLSEEQSGRKIRVGSASDLGAFYCEVARVDTCVGAPGGSSGGVPDRPL